MDRRNFMLLAVPPVLKVPLESLNENIVSFQNLWIKFLMTLYNCNKDEVMSQETCKVAGGTLDYNLWNKLRSEAKKLFILDERRN